MDHNRVEPYANRQLQIRKYIPYSSSPKVGNKFIPNQSTTQASPSNTGIEKANHATNSEKRLIAKRKIDTFDTKK